MPKVIPFALKINGKQLHNLDELKNNFEIEKIVGYFRDGRLLRWLKSHRFYDVAEKVAAIENVDNKNAMSQLYNIFDMMPPDDLNIDVEETVKRHNHLTRVQTFTDNPEILAKEYIVALSQSELDDLIQRDAPVIYLCNGEYTIPLEAQNKTYIGIQKVVAVIPSTEPVDFDELHIKFQNISLDDEYEKIHESPEAMYSLGNSYYIKGDYKKAVEWYEKAAAKGQAGAMYSLGYCYQYERGVTKDYKKAVEWYEKAAAKGHASAMWSLGNCYYYGRGVDTDKKKAVEWFKKAAALGHSDAKSKLRELGITY